MVKPIGDDQRLKDLSEGPRRTGDLLPTTYKYQKGERVFFRLFEEVGSGRIVQQKNTLGARHYTVKIDRTYMWSYSTGDHIALAESSIIGTLPESNERSDVEAWLDEVPDACEPTKRVAR